MAVPELVASLLTVARKDFDALRGMENNNLFADEIFGFHAQQAVEKTLKAWLAFMSVEFPFTHDISRLLSMLEDVPTDVSEHWHLIELNVFAVQARYESGLVGDEQSIDRSTMIDDVERLLLHVERIVASI